MLQNKYVQPFNEICIGCHEEKQIHQEVEGDFYCKDCFNIFYGHDTVLNQVKTERTKMEEKEVKWDEAFPESQFVKFDTDKPKELTIKDWKLVKTSKFEEEVVELRATVLKEDGKDLSDSPKQFTTTSTRLKKKLKELLESKDPATAVSLKIIRVGEKFDTQYSVQEV